MNVARWTRAPHIEWEIEKEARALRDTVWQARLAFAAVPLWLVVAAFLPGDFEGVGPIFVILALFAIYGSAKATSAKKSARDAHWSRDAAVIDEFGVRSGWLVELIVHGGDAPLGTDRGMMWIEEGRLYFAGRRTSFGLTADQTAGPCERVRAVPGLRHGLRLPLRASNAFLSFTVVRPAKWQMAMRDGEVAEVVKDWIARREATGGQLPPLEPGPGSASAHRLLAKTIVSFGYWPALLLLVRWSNLFDFSLAAIVFLLGLGAGGALPSLSSPALWLRAYRDRRRLP